MRFAAIALLFLAACGAPEPARTTSSAAPPSKPAAPPLPSPAAAQPLITDSATFSDYEFTNASVTLPTKGALPPYMAGDARQLVAAGWLRRAGDGLELGAKAKDDKRFLVRPNGTVDVVPLASKELTAVTAVRPNPDGTAAADFTWKWIPNEVGSAFERGALHDRYAAPQNATATLMWDGSAWTVLRIEKR
jgi:hypothetical protein